MNDIVLIVFFFMWYLLIFASILFTISGLDDFFIDIYYWRRFFKRKKNYKKHEYPSLTYQQLSGHLEKKIAIMTPCWHEANIIDVMLKNNCSVIDYKEYCFFVGVYPNDPETIASVEKAAKVYPQIQCVIGSDPGPTNKGSNLNHIFNYIKKYEQEKNIHFDIFVLHDSEDIIHPLSLKLYNYLIPRKDMIQIPVFPLEVGYLHFTHWIYNDEFAEIHTKDIIVRESFKGLVPSAGVGTAFARTAMDKLAKENPTGLGPFPNNTLTEDYSTALQLRAANCSQIFLVQAIKRSFWVKKYGFFGKYVMRVQNEFIATRELFPMHYSKAVRQKARWILGISIQEWINSGWNFDSHTVYTLIHDRKALFTHLINVLGYFIFLFWVIYGIWSKTHPNYPLLQDQLNYHPWVWILIVFTTLMMINRIIQRIISVYRVYGPIPAILSMPRLLYGNIVNLHALLRAYNLFFLTNSKSKPTTWDKTEHEYPGTHVFVPYKIRLGDLLVKKKIISLAQLQDLLAEQNTTGEQLGSLLMEKKFLTEDELTVLLAEQNQLPIIPKTNFKILPVEAITGITPVQYKWLIKHHCLPYQFDEQRKILTLAIRDPSNEKLVLEARHLLKNYEVHFAIRIGDIEKSEHRPNKTKPKV